MNNNAIDAAMLSKMFLGAADNLNAHKDIINELNVFPVPDGDTGTNMTMTITSAAKAVKECENPNMESICKCISQGSLRGARGNSGVILSQLLRGFTKVAKEHDAIDCAIVADGFDKAVETAYKAVMSPKEGTILTVAKGAAEKARELANNGADDLEPFAAEIIKYADETLAKTPDMLPVLKQAGVVDSGGRGLVEVLKGAFDVYLGKEISFEIPEEEVQKNESNEEQQVEIKFGYCTEFIIILNKKLNVKQEMDLRNFLESIGDSIVLVPDDEICKIHVHTNDPGLVIQKALLYGQLSNMKIDNMHMEHREKLFHLNADGTASEMETEISGQAEKTIPQPVQFNMSYGKEIPLTNTTSSEHAALASEYLDEETDYSEKKDFGFVTVCAGDGMHDIFKDLGADYVIKGGQTMNPSTEDILSACEKVNADTIFILPNNKNIIMAAKQAAQLAPDDKKYVVVPSKTIPQGITALINFIPDQSADDNLSSMVEAIEGVSTGEVTYAVRDTVIDDVQIRQGDYMGIGDSGILTVGKSIEDVTSDMIDKISADEAELISIYFGSDITEQNANDFADRVRDNHPDCDVELQFGGQPIYYYIVSAE